MGFIPGCKVGSTYETKKVIYHIEKEQKSHIHLNKEKALDRIQHIFMIRVLNKPGRELPLLKIRNKTKMRPLSSLLFNTVSEAEVLARTWKVMFRQEKK